ncbi:helix-turn-helix domain-containing protein [Nostoc sp.]|uniref:helix-turn-helix domain-containing protein n=1 Tax=Nostoc sp. TaxID=1180 RepID=UPI003FA5AF44
MLTNYVYKLRPNVTQSIKMSGWLDMLRSTYNWSLGDRIAQYNPTLTRLGFWRVKLLTGHNQTTVAG